MKKLIASALTFSALALSTATFAADYKAGDMVVRGGLTMVQPDSSDAAVYLNGADSTLSISVEDNTQLGLNFLYFIDSNWAVEVLAATPFKHDVVLHDEGGVINGIYGADLNGANLAEVTHLPPTVSALYYFDTASNLKPYVGVGLNYTVFFDEEFTSTPDAVGFSNLELDGSFGYALQAGADYYFNDNWHINASVRYIDISTDATFDVVEKSDIPADLVGVKGSATVDVDPFVYSLMVGYKF